MALPWQAVLTGCLLSGSVNSNYSVSSVASSAGQVGYAGRQVQRCHAGIQLLLSAGSNYGLGGTSVDAAGFVSITADSFATGKIARLLNGVTEPPKRRLASGDRKWDRCLSGMEW